MIWWVAPLAILALGACWWLVKNWTDAPLQLVIQDVEQVVDEASRVSTQIIEASRRKISVADTAPQMAEEATKAAALGKKEID